MTYHGHCTCGEIAYQMDDRPLFVHCCHCRWCQRETGSAFILNALIEATRVRLTRGTPETVALPTFSGQVQRVSRCPTCQVALWSVYPGAGPAFMFLRVSTLEQADDFPPDIHIFTATKQPWVILPEGPPVVAEYYDRADHWPGESLARRQAVLEAEQDRT